MAGAHGVGEVDDGHEACSRNVHIKQYMIRNSKEPAYKARNNTEYSTMQVSYYLVLYMQKVSVLFSALYAKSGSRAQASVAQAEAAHEARAHLCPHVSL